MQVDLKKTHLLVLLFFYIFNLNLAFCQRKDSIESFDFNIDNPWLSLKALQMSYPDLIKNISFDVDSNDWFITIRNQNLYWANGRLLLKKDIKNWRNWSPIISYFYTSEVQNPNDFSENFISSLKPKVLIKNRKETPPPNYTFAMLLYNGKNRKQILKQIRRSKFLGYDIWIHQRIAVPLRRVQEKIYVAKKTDKEVKKFLKELKYCWSFNWRIIADSGKISNHSWGSAIDLLPRKYRNKKIYWYWEATRNDNWMKIMPYRRWAPPKAVIEAFESEGFIWGGNWTLWDNMHFEYRPELLYIKKFVLSQDFNDFIAKDTEAFYADTEIGIIEKKKIPKKFADIFRIIEFLKFTSFFSQKMHPFYGFINNTEDIDEDIEEPEYLEEMLE